MGSRKNSKWSFQSNKSKFRITNIDHEGQSSRPYCKSNERENRSTNVEKNSSYTNVEHKRGQKKYFGFKHLEELCKKDPSEMVFVMCNRDNGFMDLFKQNKDPDWLFLLMEVTAKICLTEFQESKHAILLEAINQVFLDHIKLYILKTPTETNPKKLKNMSAFFNNCLTVFQSITSIFPRTAVERLKDLIISSNVALSGIKEYNHEINIDNNTYVGMIELHKKIMEIVICDEVKTKEKKVVDNIVQLMPPPENFRELTVYPVAVDLDEEKPFIRPNILRGAYQSVEHYLDVQFRLLREDFIAPLREGIKLYKERMGENLGTNKRKRINNIRVYNNVEFEKKGEFVHDKSGFILNFNKYNKLKVNWDIAKRFMYGSLLVFTMDNFSTFFLGIVLERKVEMLKDGKLIVELFDDMTPTYYKNFTMVESEVFFEPYKCSMQVLKNINDDNFPMAKYIISASKEIDHPSYIDELPVVTYKIGDMAPFTVLNDNEWPTQYELGLDGLQYNAFKAALQNEFVIIQGPPGTGKTFIGLKIMKTLIENLYRRNTDNKDNKLLISYNLTNPILVVCYTNHALDQFMEGILEFTNRVVRIGGQSKSEQLTQYSLMNITRNHRRSYNITKGLRDVRDKVKTIMYNIKYYRKCAELVSYNHGVLDLSLLKHGIPKYLHYFFRETSDLLKWLFQDSTVFNVVDPVAYLTMVYHKELERENYQYLPKYKANLLNVKKCTDNYEQLLIFDDYDEENRYEFEDPDLVCNVDNIVVYCVTVQGVKEASQNYLSEAIRLKNEYLAESNIHYYNEFEEAQFNYEMTTQIHNYILQMMTFASRDNYINTAKLPKDLNRLTMMDRWVLYFKWVDIVKQMFGPKITHLEMCYSKLHNQYTELREMENALILNEIETEVVAMTTTGAAKHRILLEGLKSPIVVVEEAAEVLEPHIISSLTRHCKHLILIGDHKQLRPSNAVYKLAKDFNFDISLFERMVNNEVPCYTLGEQHRMRPEIASLVSPIIYPILKNHESVYNRDHVLGISKDVFFLNHNVFEKEVEEISSKSNEHEARFLIMLARHLILQGYTTDQVTILTTYSGQMFQLRSLQKKYPMLKGVKITVVDNYQGEESDIILLSLVRSNEDGKVGFLKTENRICVALSRAKFGLYMIGNMGNLYNSGELWKKIKTTLEQQESYGNELTLECVIHNGIFTKVSKSEDFDSIMEGGCTMLCNSLMPCGHICLSVCHPYDREHREMICRESCLRACNMNHSCKKKCFIDCGKCIEPVLRELPCGHEITLECNVNHMTYDCQEEVVHELIDCGHKIVKKCYDKNPKCTFKCFDRLECGHACTLNCHKTEDPDHIQYECKKPCEKVNKNCEQNHQCKKFCFEDCALCSWMVDKELPCGHIKKKVLCAFDAKEIKCFMQCERKLKCDHSCKLHCFQPCRGCEVKVKKTIPDCGHSVTLMCKKEPIRKHCVEKCTRTLPCGHVCPNLCGVDCSGDNCKELVLKQSRELLACGHDKVWVFCCDKDKEFKADSKYLLEKCREPCLEKLICGDTCFGTCGKCKQGRLHIPCEEKCNKINPCNHKCNSPCKSRCPPCNQKCSFSCVHSKCTEICGKPCAPCLEKCQWKCKHMSCTKKCGELCNRNPCYAPCKRKLECGHDCIGFCGEPCPPLCRVCDEEEVTSIIFGYEDEQESRFIYLEDCGHTIESKGLEQWIEQSDEEITMKQCPLCKTPILKTQRFMNKIKQIYNDISEIKKKFYGEIAYIKSQKKSLCDAIFGINKKFDSMFIGDINKHSHVKKQWENMSDRIILKNAQKKYNYDLSVRDIESLYFVVDLLKSMSKYKERINKIESQFSFKQQIIDHFVWLSTVALNYGRQLSNQQKFDINMEMARGVRLISLCKLLCNYKFVQLKAAYNNLKAPTEVKNVTDVAEKIKACLMSHEKYSNNTDTQVQQLFDSLNEKMEGLKIVITDDEKYMINAAMSKSFGGSRSQGHWKKCQNGHIFCITECGSPMIQTKCPECQVNIGRGAINISTDEMATQHQV